ncbi:MAG: HlyC/CorC family transporter [Bacteroidales bacterium]|nr:HlyC/CorC family transporter [Bacteroidales bacterium]
MEILIIILFVLLNGFFSMAEIAVVSSRRTKLESEAKKGDKTSQLILATVDRSDRFLSAIQIAITTIGLIIGLYTGESYVNRLAEVFAKMNVDASFAVIISRVVIVMVETFFMLVFGELLPKRIGMSNPEKVSGIVIRPMNFITRLFAPLVSVLSWTTSSIAKLIGIKNVTQKKATEEEIKSIIDDSADAGEIDQTEQDIVNRVFDLDSRSIVSLMTPRNELEWLERNDTLKDIAAKVAHNLHYIYPVCNKSLDDIVGVMYIKDVFSVAGKETMCVGDIMREPQFIHESVSVYDILKIFKKTKIHYAFIIDEFGMVQGMVTMNDILEAIIGNSAGLESEGGTQEFVKRDDGSYLIDGQYPFYDFLSHFDLEDMYQQYGGYNTISGLILAITGKVPKVGEKIQWNGFTIEIVDMDSVRIDKVLVIENKDKSK